ARSSDRARRDRRPPRKRVLRDLRGRAQRALRPPVSDQLGFEPSITVSPPAALGSIEFGVPRGRVSTFSWRRVGAPGYSDGGLSTTQPLVVLGMRSSASTNELAHASTESGRASGTLPSALANAASTSGGTS